jgi:hypothetical protein
VGSAVVAFRGPHPRKVNPFLVRVLVFPGRLTEPLPTIEAGTEPPSELLPSKVMVKTGVQIAVAVVSPLRVTVSPGL